MNTYTRKFFDKNFTENKNTYKVNEIKNQVNNQAEQAPFKVERIEKIVHKRKKEVKEIKEEYRTSIKELFKSRINTIGNFFYELAQRYFKEEVV